jgi:hypothetical protein
MKHSRLIILIVFIWGCHNDNVKKSYYANGKIKSEEFYKNGLKNGVYKEYYENGTLKELAFFKDNKQDSVTKMYYISGIVQIERSFKDGKLNGLCKTYYPNGSLKSIATFDNGIENGHEERDQDGEVIPLYHMIVKPITSDTISVGQTYEAYIEGLSVDSISVFIGSLDNNDSIIWSSAKKLKSYENYLSVLYTQVPTQPGKYDFTGIIQYKNRHLRRINAPFKWSFYVKPKT